MSRKDAIPLLIKKLTYNIDNPVLWKKVLGDIHNDSNDVLSISWKFFVSQFMFFIESRNEELNANYPVYKKNVVQAISSLINEKDYENDYFEYIYEDMLESLRW